MPIVRATDITRKAVRFAMDGVFRIPFYHLSLQGGDGQMFAPVATDPWSGADGHRLIAGHFEYGGYIFDFDVDTFWSMGDYSPSMGAYLHGFEWLRSLRTLGGEKARRFARRVINDWIRDHTSWQSIPWRGDVVGTRLSMWVGLYDFFCASADEQFRSLFFRSIRAQKRHLKRIIWLMDHGLPRLRAMHGLVLAQLCMGDRPDIIDYSLEKISQECRLLTDEEGHALSRLPDDHYTLFRLLTSIRSAATRAGYALPTDVGQIVEKLALLVRFFSHGDGTLAFESDPESIHSRHVITDVGTLSRPGLCMGDIHRFMAYNTLVFLETGAGVIHHPSYDNEPAPIPPFSFEMSCGAHKLIAHGSPPLLLPSYPGDRRQGAWTIQNIQREGDKSHHWFLGEAIREEYGMTFHHRRRIYVTNSDFRGEDIVTSDQSMPFVVWFDLPYHVHSIQQSSVTFNDPEGASWMFQFSGKHTMSFDNGRLIVMGETAPIHDHSHVLTWSLQKISL